MAEAIIGQQSGLVLRMARAAAMVSRSTGVGLATAPASRMAMIGGQPSESELQQRNQRYSTRQRRMYTQSITRPIAPNRTLLLARSATAGVASSSASSPRSSVSQSKVHPHNQTRHSSHSPLGPPSAVPVRRITLPNLLSLYRSGTPITMLTAHDFPSATVAAAAGIEMVLVGDSLAMVALGMEDTSEVTLEDMLLHCRSVVRGVRAGSSVESEVPVAGSASPFPPPSSALSNPTIPGSKIDTPNSPVVETPTPATTTARGVASFIVADLPMGSYEISPAQALASSIRLVKEGRVQAVKLEGGAHFAPTIATIVRAGIPVIGHIGLTPQRQNSLGGFRVQGKTVSAARLLLADALAVQEAGASMVVLEAVPEEVSAWITSKLSIPTIGIGAGKGCSGQVLVQVDMSGYFPPGRHLPRFVKRYGDVWSEGWQSAMRYRDEVKAGIYPSAEFAYGMGTTTKSGKGKGNDSVRQEFLKMVREEAEREAGGKDGGNEQTQ